jgi:acetyltransferase-like isoleucine patch superfamily enzyme
LRGAAAGRRFGVGRRCRFYFPECLSAGDDVSIADDGYLHCLSDRGVRIGSRSSIDPRVWLHCGGQPGRRGSGYFEMGSDSYIGANAVVGAGGGVMIGSHVLIGQSVNFHAEEHEFGDTTRLIRQQGVRYAPIVIEDNVWIGSKATILAGVTVGEGSVIGASAVVTKSVPRNVVALGVPARVVRGR